MKTFTVNLTKTDDIDFVPSVKFYLLDVNGDAPRPMVIICPGGAYYDVVENWEGERIAVCYNAAGFHAAVVDYTVRSYVTCNRNLHPLPIRNVAEVIDICRRHSEEWQLDPEKVAVCGFSAGGHLAASISTLWNCREIFTQEEIDAQKYRPNATVLCYPVISSGDFSHKTSISNLLGSADENNPEWSLLSLENQVDSETPPAFLWHTFMDNAVPMENSMLYASALRKNNIPFELHIYPIGDHGQSLTTKGNLRTKSIFPREYGWMKFSIDWLAETFRIK